LRRDFDQPLARLLEAGNESGEFELEDAAMTAVSIGGLITWVPAGTARAVTCRRTP